MPTNADYDEDEVSEFIETGGVSKSTLKQKSRCESHFNEFLSQNGLSLAEALEKKEALEDLLIKYISTFRVKREMELPSRNTIEQCKSFLKTLILAKSSGSLDISKASLFPKFDRFWKSFLVKLKGHGKGDTNHHEEIPTASLAAIYELLQVLSDLMVMDENDSGFRSRIVKIPKEHRESYHYLAQYGFLFIVLTQVTIWILTLKT